MHNSLNYLSFRTDKGTFAPYGAVEREINTREVYLLLDSTRLSAEEIRKALELVGQIGYGKESGIGKGRFTVESLEECNLPDEGRYFMTLAPAALEATEARECWYEPFTRFGRHGDARAKKAPFKRPLLLADTGAVLGFDEADTRRYVGRGLTGVSPAHSDTVHQGYAIVIAIGEVAA
jgi:CRISPR-associated protein Csm4